MHTYDIEAKLLLPSMQPV